MTNSAERKRQAIWAIVGLVLWGLSPIILKGLGLPDRKNLYTGLPSSRGPASGTVERSIFEDTEDSDIVFVGASTLYGAITFPDVESAFKERFQRPGSIKVLALHDCGPDMQYVMLSDYLARHKTKVVALALPWRCGFIDGPSSGLSGLLRFGEKPDVTDGLATASVAKIYAEQVLGAPRQLLNFIRPNRMSYNEKTDQYRNEQVQSQRLNVGFVGGKFKSMKLGSTFPPTESANFKADSKEFQLTAKPLNPLGYSAKFYNKIKSLCRSNNARLVLLQLPELADGSSDLIPTNLPLEKVFGSDVNVVAVVPKTFHQFAPGEQFKNLFYDDLHLNRNGALIYQHFAISLVLDEFVLTQPGK